MTNEEILSKQYEGKAYSAVKDKEVLSAMDAAREDEAVGFAEWKDMYFKYSYPIDGRAFSLKEYESVSVIQGVSYGAHYNVAQLYQIFKNKEA